MTRHKSRGFGYSIEGGANRAFTFFEDIVYEDYDSYEDAKFDSDGALVLAGVFKTDRVKVSYRLEFVKNDAIWKWSGIKVNADKLR